MGCSVLLLSTVETKKEATNYFVAAMENHGVHCYVLDLSLNADGAVWSGERKLEAMADVARQAGQSACEVIDAGATAVVAIGGGTGGEIALDVMRQLPFAIPKVLVTTLPFDPRYAVADNAVTIVPTLADVCGLNEPLRQVLENAAAMLAGLCKRARRAPHVSEVPSVGVTALGATGPAAEGVARALTMAGHEATVFHANGFGGAAFARFARCGAFHTVIDLTCHELNRIYLAGAHAEMHDRFTVAADKGLPQIVLPGALNFIGLGELALIPEHYRQRPHYQHSGYFTHVQVTDQEMELVAGKLADALNGSQAPVCVLVPMGGFSHQDMRGGALEAPHLRDIFWQTMTSRLSSHIELIRLDSHICDAVTVQAVMEAAKPFLPDLQGNDNVHTKT